jgi:hypothetical protein
MPDEAGLRLAARIVWAIAFWNGDDPGDLIDKQREDYRRKYAGSRSIESPDLVQPYGPGPKPG